MVSSNDVVLDSEDLLVIGGPSYVTLDLDFGRQGQRGSIIWSGSSYPLSSDVIIGDFFLNTDTSSENVNKLYQYVNTSPPSWQYVSTTRGLQGLQGIKGNTGTQGTQGIIGLQGIQGLQGTQGTQGIQGLQGAQGLQGTQGLTGFGYQGITSSTALTVGLGSKTFDVNKVDALTVGTRIRAVNGANVAVMDGNISSIVGTSITVTVDYIEGSGSYSSWNFSVIGVRGIQGTTGIQGVAGTSPTYTESFISGDITMTTAGTQYTVSTLSLSAGTYVLFARASVTGGATNTSLRVTGRLASGATVVGESEASAAGVNSVLSYAPVNVTASVTLASTTTITFSCFSTTASSIIKANPGDSAAGTINKTSGVFAIKIA